MHYPSQAYVVSTDLEVDALSAPCRALMESAADRHFEGGKDWYGNLQRTVFSGKDEARYISLMRDGVALAVLPVRFATRANVRSICSLSNYYTSLFTPPFRPDVSSDEIRIVIEQAIGRRWDVDEVRFAPLDKGSNDFLVLKEALRLNKWFVFEYFCFGNWYLSSPGTWDAYLKTRTSKLRSNIKRASKKFIEVGGRLEILMNSNDADSAISAFQRVYSKSWKVPEPHPEFVPSLIRFVAAQNMLRMGVAWLADTPIAAQLWIVDGRCARIFKVAYDDAHAELSLGTLLTAHLMECVLDQDRVEEVDFLAGDDPYKRLWMSDRRERWGIIAFNPRTPAGLALLARETSGRVFRRVSAIAVRMIRYLRSSLVPSSGAN